MIQRAPRAAPIFINFMLAIHTRVDPAEALGLDHWNSPGGHEVRAWLVQNDLATPDLSRATLKGRTWIKMVCSTPLPVPHWGPPGP